MERDTQSSGASFVLGAVSAWGIAVALGLTLAIAAPASAGGPITVVLGASKDNTLYESPTGALSNGAGDSLFAGRTAIGELRRGVIAFNIASSVPPDSRILSAELRLQMTKTRVGTMNVTLHRLIQAWGEGTSVAIGQEGRGAPATPGDATWLHTFHPSGLWAAAGGDFVAAPSATTPVSGNGSYVWTSAGLVNDVQQWNDDPATNHGWAILGNEQTSITAKRFASRENLNAAFRPTLTITYVPTPASSLALGACLTACAARRRRST